MKNTSERWKKEKSCTRHATTLCDSQLVSLWFSCCCICHWGPYFSCGKLVGPCQSPFCSVYTPSLRWDVSWWGVFRVRLPSRVVSSNLPFRSSLRWEFGAAEEASVSALYYLFHFHWDCWDHSNGRANVSVHRAGSKSRRALS